MLWHKKWSSFAIQPCSLHGQTATTITGTLLPDGNFYKYHPQLFKGLGIFNFGKD